MTRKKHAVRRTKKKKASCRMSPFSRFLFSFLRTSAIVLVFVVGVALVGFDSSVLNFFSASIPQQEEALNEKEEGQKKEAGILLAVDPNGENEQKLLDIFKSVFPNIIVTVLPYQSFEGKQLIEQFGIIELPTLLFKKSAFDSEPLASSVQSLFAQTGDYELLKAEMVNPSGQLRFGNLPPDKEEIRFGNEQAPVTIAVWSDVFCQNCRVYERNTADQLKALVTEGRVQILYRDVTVTEENAAFGAALRCAYQQKKDLEIVETLRHKLYRQANLTKEYLISELKKLRINACDEVAFKEISKDRVRQMQQMGIMDLPGVLIGKTGGNEWVRFTGEKEFSVYEQFLKE